MKIEYDPRADAAYVTVGADVRPGTILVALRAWLCPTMLCTPAWPDVALPRYVAIVTTR
jgi:hypothetical protein